MILRRKCVNYQEVHKFSPCFLKILRHKEENSATAGRDKSFVCSYVEVTRGSRVLVTKNARQVIANWICKKKEGSIASQKMTCLALPTGFARTTRATCCSWTHAPSILCSRFFVSHLLQSERSQNMKNIGQSLSSFYIKRKRIFMTFWRWVIELSVKFQHWKF